MLGLVLERNLLGGRLATHTSLANCVSWFNFRFLKPVGYCSDVFVQSDEVQWAAASVTMGSGIDPTVVILATNSLRVLDAIALSPVSSPISCSHFVCPFFGSITFLFVALCSTPECLNRDGQQTHLGLPTSQDFSQHLAGSPWLGAEIASACWTGTIQPLDPLGTIPCYHGGFQVFQVFQGAIDCLGFSSNGIGRGADESRKVGLTSFIPSF